MNADLAVQVFTGQIPYYQFRSDYTVIAKVIQGVKPSLPENKMTPEFTEHMWKIMQDCWVDTPSDRPTLDQVLERLRENAPLPSRAEPRSPPDNWGGTLVPSEITLFMNVVSELVDFYLSRGKKLRVCP